MTNVTYGLCHQRQGLQRFFLGGRKIVLLDTSDEAQTSSWTSFGSMWDHNISFESEQQNKFKETRTEQQEKR